MNPAFRTGHVTVYSADVLVALASMPDKSVDCVVTSPPYWGLRDYGVAGQLGLEPTPAEYVQKMVEVFREVRRVLTDRGTLWLNLGDSYAGSWGNYGGQNRGNGTQREVTVGSMPVPAWDGREQERPAASRKHEGIKPKDLVGIPWRVAFALQADGWYLRSDIIWAKPNPMPESVTDRPTKAHEYVFLLSKSERYFFDQEAVREPNTTIGDQREGAGRFTYDEKYGPQNGTGPQQAFVTINPAGRNIRTVWTIATQPYPEAHFATFPRALPERCIKAGCPEDGTVLDPFAGSGTTLAVARDLGRKSIGIELNPAYVKLIERRCAQEALDLGA